MALGDSQVICKITLNEDRNTAKSESNFVGLRSSSAWKKPCRKEVQREHLPHHLHCKCSVLHCYTADGQKQEFLFVRLQILSERK